MSESASQTLPDLPLNQVLRMSRDEIQDHAGEVDTRGWGQEQTPSPVQQVWERLDAMRIALRDSCEIINGEVFYREDTGW